MPRGLWVTLVVVGQAVAGGTAGATPFTPLEWQIPVRQHAVRGHVGQHKHLGWVRDKNRNFIDDEVDKRMSGRNPAKAVDLIVDLNTCLPDAQLKATFNKFGKISYVGKLITFIMLDGVKPKDVAKIAELPDVAMVELQVVSHTTNDIATRAIGAHSVPGGVTGAGTMIAILDTGVDDLGHQTFAMPGGGARFHKGYDAFTDTDTNPADGNGHGTHVAATALGAGVTGLTTPCRDPGTTPLDCAGVAPAARLVDIRVCDNTGACPALQIARGLDWLGRNRGTAKARIANMSIINCVDDDGTSAMAQQVNYLVSFGISVVAAHGDANNAFCSPALTPGQTITSAPGSASLAITVGATNDGNTVARGNDVGFSQALRGPRNNFSLATPNLAALKPDITAPGEGVRSAQSGTTNGFRAVTSTSVATALVSGSIALILETLGANGKTLDPGGIKDLLLLRADQAQNPASGMFPSLPAPWNRWDATLGVGMLDVVAAAGVAGAANVKFPSCVHSAATAGTICEVTPGMNKYFNNLDILTSAPPHVGVTTTITARVFNASMTTPADVSVNFGVYAFAAGNNQFLHIGSKRVTVPPNTTVNVDQDWTPISASHQCVQIHLDYGLDDDASDNVTQRNLDVAPSVYRVRIENSFMEPAHYEVTAKSNRDGWVCKLDQKDQSFDLDPFECPRNIQITFDAPPGTAPNERANCDVQVRAGPLGQKGPRGERAAPKLTLIGGVVAQTYVPKPCRLVGMVVDARRHPVAGAVVTFKQQRNKAAPVDRATSDEDGVFDLKITPDLMQDVTVDKTGIGKHAVPLRPLCGAGRVIFVLTKDGLRLQD